MKILLLSGFLGSGKTTTMIALTKYFTEKHGKAAMISNDLGHGSIWRTTGWPSSAA